MTTNRATSHPYQDPELPVERRVEDLLERLPLEDKAGLLFHTVLAPGDLNSAHRTSPLQSARSLVCESRITHFNVVGVTLGGAELARWHNSLQALAADQPVAIPVTLSTDPRHHFTDNPAMSMLAGPFSQWPEALGMAAIGSEQLVREFADIARQEYVAVGIRVALHPQLDLATEPRWCRISATFGEDADLAARLGVAYVRGLQGESIGQESVAAMAKHFPGGGPQKDGSDPHFPWGREQIYPGGNFEYHLRPFRAVIEAGVAQIMPYYGMRVGTEFEEVGFSFNKAIITGILREQLGFDGVVCTDWSLITDQEGQGELSAARAWGVEDLTREERILKLLDAGVDQFGGEHCTDVLVRLVKEGAVDESRIDVSAARLLRQKFALGLFDNALADEDAAATVVGSAAFRAAGRRAQQRALTLLKNEASAAGTPTLPLGLGIRVYAEGFADPTFGGRAVVVDDPSSADVAILRVQGPWTPHAEGSYFPDSDIEFAPDELARLRGMSGTVPTVLDIYLQRPAVIGELTACAKAVVANFGIEESALVEVLFGDASPEGRLPFDLPGSMASVLASRSDVPFDTADPVFRFGHGLRYHQ